MKKSGRYYLKTAVLSAALILGVCVHSITGLAASEVNAETLSLKSVQGQMIVDLEISTKKELEEFAKNVNNGNTYSGKVVKLKNDIAFDGTTANNFTPIKEFEGTFDGCGYTVSGINVTDGAYAGLFASVKGGVVKNVTVSNSSFSGKQGLPIGGIVAWLWKGGSVSNCHVIDSTIESNTCDAGGIVGTLDDGTVMNCSSNSTVASNKTTAGGIVGRLGGSGSVVNSCNSGNVTSDGITSSIGGVCGILSGTVQNCYNTGNVTGKAEKTVKIGGIAGWVLYGTVANCYTAEESAEFRFGSMDGNESNCKAFSISEMKTTAFLDLLNANRGDNKGWFLWEFRGDSSYPLTVKLIRLADCNVALAEGSYTYDGQAKTPAVSATYGNYTMVKDEDYTVFYTNNINAGTATAVISGTGMYTGETASNFVIDKATPTFTYQKSVTKNYGAASFMLGAKLQNGTGKLKYKTSNSKVAKVNSNGKVTVTGTGRAVITITCAAGENYNQGVITTTIKVKPKKPDVTLSFNTDKVTVKWKKDSRATGYKVQYANNKSFTKNCKTKFIRKNKRNLSTISGLKQKTTYYIRVCAYKTTKVNGKKVDITGSWSKVRKITR